MKPSWQQKQRNKAIFELEEDVDRLRPRGPYATVSQTEPYYAATDRLMSAREALMKSPWVPETNKRTLSSAGGIKLLEEASGDIDTYEKLLKSELEILQNTDSDYEQQNEIRKKLWDIQQFRMYQGNEPIWKKKRGGIIGSSYNRTMK